MAARGLDCDWLADADGRLVLWRTSGNDAQSWWPVCLLARSLLTDVGFSLRLDPFPRNSNWNNCCCRRWLCALLGCTGALDWRGQIHHQSYRYNQQLRCFPVNSAINRPAVDRPPHLHEHPRLEAREARSKHIYHYENRCPRGFDSARIVCGLEI